MPLPVVVAGALSVLKDIGILASSFVVMDWLSDSPDPDGQLGEGWVADISRQQFADEYQQTYDQYAPHLSGPRLQKLHASVLLAKKAVMEPSATVWNGQADALADGLDAMADRLMAQELGVTPAGTGAQITLKPTISLVGGEMALTVGDAPPQAAGMWGLAVMLGMGGLAYLFLARS